MKRNRQSSMHQVPIRRQRRTSQPSTLERFAIRLTLLLVCPLLLSVNSPLCLAQQQEAASVDVEIERKYSGKSRSAEPADRPSSRVVKNDGQWASTWRLLRGNELIPSVDFSRSLVILETVDGPNNVFVNRLQLDATGDLQFETASSRMGGPGFGYLMLVVPRQGIRSIKGQPLAEAASGKAKGTADGVAIPPATMPVEQEALAAVAAVADEASRLSAGLAIDTADEFASEATTEEFIHVEMVGRIRSGMRVAGRDQTIALLSANGRVVELNTQENAALAATIASLDRRVARVVGRVEGPSELAPPSRFSGWQVVVEQVEAIRSGQSAAAQPKVAEPLVSNLRPGMAPRPYQPPASPPADARAANEARGGETSPAAGAGTQSFAMITVMTTGGGLESSRLRVVNADGAVQWLNRRTGEKSAWQIPAAELSKLHAFVDRIDWSQIPRNVRSGDPDVFQYTISIQTGTTVNRFVTDTKMAGEQPEVVELFSYLRQPKQR